MIVCPHSIVLDSEALSALAAGDRRMQAWATLARRTDSVLYAATVTLAEVTDGSGRDARVRQAAKAVRLVPVDADAGFAAGPLRAAAVHGRRTARDLTIDALVAATALGLPAPAIVLTADAADFDLLLVDAGVKVAAV